MNIDFFCFQPILFNEKTFFYIQSNNFIPKDNWEKINTNYKNEKYCGIIDYLKFIERHEIYLLNDFSNSVFYDFKKLNNIEFLEVDKGKTTHAIFYDKDYKIFFIIFKISINLKPEFNNNNLIGLYKEIRNELVYDTVDHNISISLWAEDIRKQAIDTINSLFKNSNSCEIIENSGYIFSSYPHFEFNDKEKNSIYLNTFLSTNHHIDLIDEKKEIFENFSFLKLNLANSIDNDSSQIFFLGWRFATIYGIKNSSDLKLIPIFLNLQNIYFQIDNFYKPYLSKLYEEIRYGNDYNTLNDKVEIFDKLEVAFQNLVFEKDKFISELKPFQFEIFKEMEDYWGMNKDYIDIEKTLKICQSSLDRKLSVVRNHIQERQSNILFVLAIIQIFSIISISVDFFNLIDLKPKDYTLFLGNTIFIVLSSVSFTLIFVAYYKQALFKIKKYFK